MVSNVDRLLWPLAVVFFMVSNSDGLASSAMARQLACMKTWRGKLYFYSPVCHWCLGKDFKICSQAIRHPQVPPIPPAKEEHMFVGVVVSHVLR